MRILLVNPSTSDQPGFQKYAVFPNGILFLAAVLERCGHEVEIYDNNVDSRKPEDFLSFSPDLIGFSVLTGRSISSAIAQSIELKSIMPGVKTVWGGVHPSLLPEQTIVEPYIDYVVVGEGEYTLLDLVRCLENGNMKLEEIKGLVYKKDGKIIKNEPRPFFKSLDELPDPAWPLVDVKRYSEVTLNSSRGCPFRCTFCYNQAFNKGRRSDFSAERVISQIEYLQQRYGVTSIKFYEDNFTANRKRLREFCSLVIRKNLKIRWSCESRVGLDEEDVALMAKSGCTWVGLGVESGSPRMLAFLQKDIKLEDIGKTCRLLVKHKIAPVAYLMAGLPTETVEDFTMTFELLRRLDFLNYEYMIYRPYPGTVLFDYCVNNGLLIPPKKLADWVNFSDLYDPETNLSEVPQELINKAMAVFRRTYPLRPLMFIVKHNPSYILVRLFNPLLVFRVLRGIIRYYANFLRYRFLKQDIQRN